MTRTGLTLFHCLTPLHNGAGQGLGSIDRPVARESTTGWPFIQSASIKGVMLAEAKIRFGENDPLVKAAFGTGGTDGARGAAAFTDAALLALPVRSMAGTFAWVTTGPILARLNRWLQVPGTAANGASRNLARALSPVIRSPISGETAARGTTEDEALRVLGVNGYVLEGLALDPDENDENDEKREQVGELARALASMVWPDAPASTENDADRKNDNGYWQLFFSQRLLLLHENTFAHLATHATEVQPNIEINDDTGVTDDGSLRYTEYLPAETLFTSLMVLDPPVSRRGEDTNELVTFCRDIANGSTQLGADQSTGKGLVRHTLTWLNDDDGGGDG